jgi:hypothetical protein
MQNVPAKNLNIGLALMASNLMPTSTDFMVNLCVADLLWSQEVIGTSSCKRPIGELFDLQYFSGGGADDRCRMIKLENKATIANQLAVAILRVVPII